jgi:CRP-like cAMP-binding protein
MRLSLDFRYTNFINQLHAAAAFEQWEVDLIISKTTFKEIKKNTVLRQEGSTVKELYFVNEGCLRTYYLDKNSRECTRTIAVENTYCWAINFLNDLAIHEYIEALADSEVIIFTKENFNLLLDSSANFRKVYLGTLEKIAVIYASRVETLITLDARERYNNLLLNRPDVILTLSNRVVASFLGITEQSLSRIKANK